MVALSSEFLYICKANPGLVEGHRRGFPLSQKASKKKKKKKKPAQAMKKISLKHVWTQTIVKEDSFTNDNISYLCS